eukprot:m.9640 g.9640  ORF g.9640 m.9640 type:complete len:757 (+) comp21502_c0_seq1:141-2411(+)
MEHLKCLAFADDLSGAADSGGELFQEGLSTQVVLYSESAKKWQFAKEKYNVVFFDCNSRMVDEEEAVRRLKMTEKRTAGLEAEVYFKKIDSTLRGNVAVELDCIMNLRNFDVCFFAPALPESGRITVGGYHLLHGVPVSHTELGRDLKSCSAFDMVKGRGSLNVKHLPLTVVLAGTQAAFDYVKSEICEKTVFVCDATSQEHLSTVAKAAAKVRKELKKEVLICGSAGIAREIPKAFSLSPSETSLSLHDWSISSLSTTALTVKGSMHSISTAQVNYLLKKERNSLCIQLNPAEEGLSCLPKEKRKVDNIFLSVEEGADGKKALNILTEATVELFDAYNPSGLIVTGGSTAASLLKALAVESFFLTKYIEPNVALCRATGGKVDSLPLVIKPGALGTEASLFSAVTAIRNVAAGTSKPTIALTMGDPCGIGPEIIAKAMTSPEVHELCKTLVIGDPDSLRRGAACCGKSELNIVEATTIEKDGEKWPLIEWPTDSNEYSVLVWNPIQLDEEVEFIPGKMMAKAGQCAAEWVISAVRLALAGDVNAIVTAPLNKEAMNLGGYKFSGHTELLARYSGAKTSRLMLVSDKLRVVHATGHCSHKEVTDKLTTERIVETTELAHQFLVSNGIADPKIAIAGLNPHAGDGGLFGNEESVVIQPAVTACQKRGWNVSGPFPADTLFGKVIRGNFDIVVAMYHDQGHIPAKLIGFDDTVNVTLGLPIIRTSVDHGTAFDIAGRGIASHGNLLKAIKLGTEIAPK